MELVGLNSQVILRKASGRGTILFQGQPFMDGASSFTIFTRLILPLSVPALASFAIFQFLWVWNDLLVALVFLGANPAVEVLTQWLYGMVGTFGTDWHLLTAGAFISMLLPLIVFFSLQRYFVRGLLAGSVKG